MVFNSGSSAWNRVSSEVTGVLGGGARRPTARGRRPRRPRRWAGWGSGLECLETRTLLSLIPTSVSVSAASASVYGQSETLTATVATPSGAPTPTSADGTVSFYDGTTLLGTATLSGSPATATLTTAELALGSHTITARYSWG